MTGHRSGHLETKSPDFTGSPSSAIIFRAAAASRPSPMIFIKPSPQLVPDLETSVVAMTDPDQTYDYPQSVRFQIREETIDDYVGAAEFLNSARLRCG